MSVADELVYKVPFKGLQGESLDILPMASSTGTAIATERTV